MLEELNISLSYINAQTQENLPILAVIVAILFSFYILNLILGNNLLRLGIFPRHLIGLRGIIFAPFIHANFNHLFFNCIPLVVLANFILLSGLNYFLDVSAQIILISGFLVWCFAKPGLHVGASGVITGYWGLLIANAYQQGTLVNIILGVICVYYFAGIFLGIFPGKKGISWEGHLFGLIAGLITSKYLYISLGSLI